MTDAGERDTVCADMLWQQIAGLGGNGRCYYYKLLLFSISPRRWSRLGVHNTYIPTSSECQKVELKYDVACGAEFLTVFLPEQDAGLVITRTDAEVRFESVELLAPDSIITGCEGRLRRRFPAAAVVVPWTYMADAAFRVPFLEAVAKLDQHS